MKTIAPFRGYGKRSAPSWTIPVRPLHPSNRQATRAPHGTYVPKKLSYTLAPNCELLLRLPPSQRPYAYQARCHLHFENRRLLVAQPLDLPGKAPDADLPALDNKTLSIPQILLNLSELCLCVPFLLSQVFHSRSSVSHLRSTIPGFQSAFLALPPHCLSSSGRYTFRSVFSTTRVCASTCGAFTCWCPT